MITFKPGDHVHVEFDGEVMPTPPATTELGPGWMSVLRPGAAYYARVKDTDCTLVRPPLRVGDVLTANDPEPPDSTVIHDGFKAVFVRRNEGWRIAGGGAPSAWGELAGPVTVLYVSEDAS